MAKFKLGAIISNIAGSIGGTTLKRSPFGFVAMNKSLGGSKSARYKNNYVTKLGNVFRRWRYLSEDAKNAWNAYALTMTFPDKFGEQKYLTGRQLFIKCNARLSMFNSAITYPDDYSQQIPDIDIDDVTLDVSNNSLLYSINLTAWEGNMLNYIERIPYANCAYRFPSSSVVTKYYLSSNISANEWDIFVKKFPNVKVGEVYRFYFVVSSYNGITASPIYVDRVAV
jgi:hypothetical protein